MPVAELRADVHMDGRADHLFDQVFPDQTRVPGGAACDDPDPPGLRELLRRDPDIRKIRLALLMGVAPAHGVQHRLRLLVDLLQHVVRIPAFFGGGGVPGDARHVARHRLAVGILHHQPVAGQNGQLSILEEQHIAHVGQGRRDIRGDKCAVASHADDQRASGARRHDRIRVLFAQHRHRIAAVNLAGRRAHRGFQSKSLLDGAGDEMSHHFGIRLGFEPASILDQRFL